jgi:hypothetical protein
MGTLHTLQVRPVQLLWSPKKGVNPAWRVAATSTVVPFSGASNLADGGLWHALSNKYQQKYGTDWGFKFGFDLDLLTPEEHSQYMEIYTATARARKGA